MATPLDIYDIPKDMRSYLRNYGHHFSRRACEFAISKMRRMNPATGKKEPVDVQSKEAIEEIFSKNGIKLEQRLCVSLAHGKGRLLQVKPTR